MKSGKPECESQILHLQSVRLFSKLDFYDFKMGIVILTFVGNLQDSRKDMLTVNWDIHSK